MSGHRQVFVSYSAEDRDQVFPVVDRLKKDGLALWVDKWAMYAGTHVVEEVFSAIRQSDVMIFFASCHTRRWQWLELGGAFTAILDRIIPIRLDDLEVPDFLQHLNHIDWFADPDSAYDRLFNACRRMLVSAPLPRAAAPQPQSLEEILGLSNRAALSLYKEYVRNLPEYDEPFDRPRETLAGGYWNAPEYAAQQKYVPVRRLETPEFIQQKACQLLADGFAAHSETPIWLIGDAGTGKTTSIYRIYFEILQARERPRQQAQSLLYPIPVMIQLQKVQLRHIEQLSTARDELDFMGAIFDIWLRRRGFDVEDTDRKRLQAAFSKAVRDGTVVLLVDSYDELGRMAVQLEVFERLFTAAKHYIAASRPELYHDNPQHQPLRIQPTWDVSTIYAHLGQLFNDLPDVAQSVAAYIESNDKILWLRNPRYLHLLALEVRRRSRSGTLSTADVLETLENGQYKLLATLYDAAVERMRASQVDLTASRGPRDPFERKVRRHLQAIAFSQVETGSLPVAIDDPDDLWSDLVAHASEIVGRRTDYTSNDDQFHLVNYNWIDFFLVDLITHDLLAASPTQPLRLQHLWTQTLLTYTAESCNPEEKAAILAECTNRLAMLQDDARNGDAQAIRSHDGINLVQLMVRLRLEHDGNGQSDRHSHQVEFHDVNLSWLDLTSIDLHRLVFRRCDFSHTNLRKADLERARFEECDFTAADLRHADADHAAFVDCMFSLNHDSHFVEMSIQGATATLRGADQRPALRERGAIVQRSRYRSPFGKLFFAHQQQMLGRGLQRAEDRYLEEIGSALDAAPGPAKQLIDLMAGGGNKRLIELLQHDTGLCVLAIDRDGRDMNDIVTNVGRRFAMIEKEIDGSTDLRILAADYFDPLSMDVVIGKKALHELPAAEQMELIRSIAAVLRERGRLILFTDSPYEIDDSGREWLSGLRVDLVKYGADLGLLREKLLDLRFDANSRSDLAVFSNLWVHLKDWANGNEHELRHRYFSGASEIIEWAERAGFRQISTPYADHYQLVARRFNENGYNQAINRLAESGDQVRPRDIAFYRSALEGTEPFRLFCEVVEHHLWNVGSERPTELGARLNAERTAVDFHTLHPSLRADSIGLSYDSGIGFDFTIHVLAFERAG